MKIRPMRDDDAEAVLAIYAEGLATGHASFETQIPSWEAFDAARSELEPRFGDWVIFEHCLPFDVSRAYDEAKGIIDPRIRLGGEK